MITRDNINKVVHIGSNIFCSISFENNNLSISGVVKPTRGGNAHSCGQIHDSIKQALDQGYNTPQWNEKRLDSFVEIWKEWHLNDMQAGCKHQTNDTVIGTLCKECNYSYGSKWLRKEVPINILRRLNDLPDTNIKPYWI